MNKTVQLLIPTYNERDNIIPLVERVHQALSGQNYRILFIDDDSKDGTAEVVRRLSAKYPVDVIVRKGKKGLASAVVDGVNSTREDSILVMDADLQHPPEVIPSLLKEMGEGADMVVASRYCAGGGCQGWGLARRIISKGAVFLSHLLLPTTRCTRDPVSGFFMFDRQSIAGATLMPTGYKILMEILVMGDFHHVAEVPYTFCTRSKGESKLSSKQQIEYLKHICSLMARSGEIMRGVKFCLVGLSGIFVNEGLLWILNQFARLPLAFASAISIESSIISNFTLNNMFTFRDRRSASKKSTLFRLLKFNLVSLGGLGINMGVLLFFTNIIGIHYLISNLIGILIAFLWNYILNLWWTWR